MGSRATVASGSGTVRVLEATVEGVEVPAVTVGARRDAGRAAVTRGTPAWPRETSRFPRRYWDEYPLMVRLRERFHELAMITPRRSGAPGGSPQPAPPTLQSASQPRLLHPPVTELFAVHEHNWHSIAVLRGKPGVVVDVLLGQGGALFGHHPFDNDAGVVAEMTARTCEQSHRMSSA